MTPPEHLVPAATGMKTTILFISHVPILVPSGEQTDCPGVVQESVDGAVAPEPDGDEPEPGLAEGAAAGGGIATIEVAAGDGALAGEGADPASDP